MRRDYRTTIAGLGCLLLALFFAYREQYEIASAMAVTAGGFLVAKDSRSKNP